jgi:coenzyme F420-reducing hydrogenase gamma subunit
MQITDLNGCPIEVTNLKEAIKMAEKCKKYHQEDKNFSEFDKRQKTYWTDMYEKLKAIKKQLDDN